MEFVNVNAVQREKLLSILILDAKKPAFYTINGLCLVAAASVIGKPNDYLFGLRNTVPVQVNKVPPTANSEVEGIVECWVNAVNAGAYEPSSGRWKFAIDLKTLRVHYGTFYDDDKKRQWPSCGVTFLLSA